MAALLAALLLPAAPPAGGCTVSISARADGSFARAGYGATPRRLERLAAQTRLRFAAAARRLCLARVLRPADLARFRELIVQNGEGATEPLIYREPAMNRAPSSSNMPSRTADPPDLPSSSRRCAAGNAREAGDASPATDRKTRFAAGPVESSIKDLQQNRTENGHGLSVLAITYPK